MIRIASLIATFALFAVVTNAAMTAPQQVVVKPLTCKKGACQGDSCKSATFPASLCTTADLADGLPDGYVYGCYAQIGVRIINGSRVQHEIRKCEVANPNQGGIEDFVSYELAVPLDPTTVTTTAPEVVMPVLENRLGLYRINATTEMQIMFSGRAGYCNTDSCDLGNPTDPGPKCYAMRCRANEPCPLYKDTSFKLCTAKKDPDGVMCARVTRQITTKNAPYKYETVYKCTYKSDLLPVNPKFANEENVCLINQFDATETTCICKPSNDQPCIPFSVAPIKGSDPRLAADYQQQHSNANSFNLSSVLSGLSLILLLKLLNLNEVNGGFCEA